MSNRTAILLVVSLLAGGCSNAHQPAMKHDTLNTSARNDSPGNYTVVSGTSMQTQRPLAGGEKVTTALTEMPIITPMDVSSSSTMILIRRGEDGINFERIDCVYGFFLLDPRKDVCLRKGDQLLVSSPCTRPVGLSRPAVAGIPVPE